MTGHLSGAQETAGKEAAPASPPELAGRGRKR